MDFDFKKSRKQIHDKRKKDKAKGSHQSHPNQQPKQNQNNSSSETKGHATPLKTEEKPASYTETDPAQFQHLKRETDEIAALAQSSKSYSRRVIVSNWNRYELPPDSPNEREEEALDFETLVNSLSNAKGHMKLSHEQSWGSERSELQEAFFNIDIHKLSTSLERAPFHVRQNLSVELFTAEQLAVFNQDAEEAKKQSVPLLEIAVKDAPVLQRLPERVESKSNSENSTGDVLTHLVPKVSNLAVISKDDAPLAPRMSFKDSENIPFPPRTQANSENISLPPRTQANSEKTENETPSAQSKDDELDIDFLLSLDSAVPEKHKAPVRVEQLVNMAPVAQAASAATATAKLDDWLDNLLDD